MTKLADFEATVDRLLRFMELGFNAYLPASYLSRAEVQQGRTDYVPLEYFDGVQPMLPEDTALEALRSMDDGIGYFMDVSPRDIDYRCNVSVMGSYDSDNGDAHKDKIIIHKTRFIQPKEVRGKVSAVARQMAEYTLALCEIGAGYHSFKRICGLIAGKWHMLDEGRLTDFSDGNPVKLYDKYTGQLKVHRSSKRIVPDEEMHKFMQLALGMQFTRRYQWFVLLGHAEKRRIGIPTDPIGARDVFRLRDIPPGAKRRAALRNWVAAHWRKCRQSEEDKTWVRHHLRGATQFVWDDLLCEIRPAAFDLERNEMYKELREVMRKNRHDGRASQS